MLLCIRERRPPRSTRNDTHVPYTTLFRTEKAAELCLRLLLRGGRTGALQHLRPVLGRDHFLGLELLLGGQRDELVGGLQSLEVADRRLGLEIGRAHV